MKTVDYFIPLSKNSIYIKLTKEVRHQNRSFFLLLWFRRGLWRVIYMREKVYFFFRITYTFCNIKLQLLVVFYYDDFYLLPSEQFLLRKNVLWKHSGRNTRICFWISKEILSHDSSCTIWFQIIAFYVQIFSYVSRNSYTHGMGKMW